MALFTVLLSLLLPGLLHGYSFLFVPMPQMGSHAKSMLPLADALVKRGHQVELFWASFNPKEKLNHKTINETFLILKTHDPVLRDIFVYENATEFHRALQNTHHPVYETHHLVPWVFVGLPVCKEILNSHKDFFDKYVSRKDIDVVVVDTHFSPCGYLIAKRMNAPSIMFSTSYLVTTTANSRGLPSPIASYPQITYSPYDFLAYYWRLFGTLVRALAEAVYLSIDGLVWYNLWQLDSSMWSFSSMRFQRNSLAVISVASQQLDFPHPHLWDVHFMNSKCPKRSFKELDGKFKDFVDDPQSKGTIIIAFGHMVRWRYAPDRMLPAFSGAFEKLPQYRFVLQYNGDPVDFPPNVLTSGWMPQKDLLLHPKTVAFVSHMGYKSYLEGICSRVPIIAYPIFAEQPKNALIAENYLRVGETVLKATVTADKLAERIESVATNEEYRKNTDKISRFIEDELIDPNDLAVFKMEFAMRHKKDVYLLRSRGAQLSWFTYFSVDTMLFLAVLGSVAIYVPILIFRRQLRGRL